QETRFFQKTGFLRTSLGEPNTLWETYTRCWVPLHSTQPTQSDRTYLGESKIHCNTCANNRLISCVLSDR
ncbi:hypothetical protein H4N54_15925, partial [Limnospira fusiformis KN01]|uniref:hypothetical protein n=1 Tax=Limnospira fusiformis TaxID=54297 RepID=UPI001658BFDA